MIIILINTSGCNLRIREQNKSFIVQDLTEVYCTDKEDVERVIDAGKTNRASAPTLMNAESSRSHSIVSVVLSQKDTSSGRNKKGTLYLVDLAGSEKVGKTGATGMRLEEAKNINASLTTLGMVINALCDGNSHIPYRDSKLTQILMDALGGNSKTTLIICCNPELSHTSETLSTLRFGERAKRIQNKARVNEELSVAELQSLLAKAKLEIKQLKMQLAAATGNNSLIVETELDDPMNDLEQIVLNENKNSTDSEKLTLRIEALEEELEITKNKLTEKTESLVSVTADRDVLKVTVDELKEKVVQQTRTDKRSSVDLTEDIAMKRHSKSTSNTDNDGIVKGIQIKVEEDSDNEQLEENDDQGQVNSKQGLKDLSIKIESDDENFEERQTFSIQEDLEAVTEKLILDSGENKQDDKEMARILANKYIRMRDEYEMHVQRILHKLTQEKKARASVEDRLDDALNRLYKYQAKSKSGFLSNFFSEKKSSRRQSFAFSGKSNDPNGMDIHERLENVQNKALVLNEELEANKEAHQIVLDTKEAVLRSLARQNTELTEERDNYQNRVRDLNLTVDQLTNLLRNVQARKKSQVNTPMKVNDRHFKAMQGGSSSAQKISFQ